jgi:hypothetical protein
MDKVVSEISLLRVFGMGKFTMGARRKSIIILVKR